MIAWLALAALTLADPSGDTHGAGDLAPPTAAVHDSLGSFDLNEVSVLDGDPLRVRIALAALDNPADLPNHVTLPIVEVYLDVDEGGEADLLPGSGMRMPQGEGWEVAIRVTGDEAFAVRSRDGERARHPVQVSADGDALIVDTPFAAPEQARLHAITGVYDPFGETGWRPIEAQSSPWSFSSPVAAPPVVDVLAADGPAQRVAIRNRELPTQPRGVAGAPWVVLMVVGLVVAGVGVALRRASPASDAPAAGSDAPDRASRARGEPSEAPGEASEGAEGVPVIVVTGADVPVADDLLVRGPAARPGALTGSDEEGWRFEEADDAPVVEPDPAMVEDRDTAGDDGEPRGAGERPTPERTGLVTEVSDDPAGKEDSEDAAPAEVPPSAEDATYGAPADPDASDKAADDAGNVVDGTGSEREDGGNVEDAAANERNAPADVSDEAGSARDDDSDDDDLWNERDAHWDRKDEGWDDDEEDWEDDEGDALWDGRLADRKARR